MTLNVVLKKKRGRPCKVDVRALQEFLESKILSSEALPYSKIRSEGIRLEFIDPTIKNSTLRSIFHRAAKALKAGKPSELTYRMVKPKTRLTTKPVSPELAQERLKWLQDIIKLLEDEIAAIQGDRKAPRTVIIFGDSSARKFTSIGVSGNVSLRGAISQANLPAPCQ